MNLTTTTFFGFSMLNILVWVVFGLVVGLIIHAIDPGDVRGGALGAIILGILGAILGGVLSAAILGVSYVGFSIPGLITAIVGGLILALLSRLIFRQSQESHYAYVGAKGGQATTKQKSRFHHTSKDGHTIINPIQVEKYLRHIDYPADKEELMTAAEAQGADDNVMHTIAEIPGNTFDGPTGVSQAIGKIKN